MISSEPNKVRFKKTKTQNTIYIIIITSVVYEKTDTLKKSKIVIVNVMFLLKAAFTFRLSQTKKVDRRAINLTPSLLAAR